MDEEQEVDESGNTFSCFNAVHETASVCSDMHMERLTGVRRILSTDVDALKWSLLQKALITRVN